jgi:hypothetical protein
MEQTRNAAIQVCFITKGKSGIMVAEELESYNTSTGQASTFPDFSSSHSIWDCHLG